MTNPKTYFLANLSVLLSVLVVYITGLARPDGLVTSYLSQKERETKVAQNLREQQVGEQLIRVQYQYSNTVQ